jgi:hypothetical protein
MDSMGWECPGDPIINHFADKDGYPCHHVTFKAEKKEHLRKRKAARDSIRRKKLARLEIRDIIKVIWRKIKIQSDKLKLHRAATSKETYPKEILADFMKAEFQLLVMSGMVEFEIWKKMHQIWIVKDLYCFWQVLQEEKARLELFKGEERHLLLRYRNNKF